jgi:hypothetical protein
MLEGGKVCQIIEKKYLISCYVSVLGFGVLMTGLFGVSPTGVRGELVIGWSTETDSFR